MERKTATRILGLASVACCVLALAMDWICIGLREGYDPLSASLSRLALGPEGWLQSLGFLASGIASISCAAGLFLAVDGSRGVMVGKTLLLLDGIPTILTAFLEMDPPGRAATFRGRCHDHAGIAAAIFFLPVCFLVAPAFRKRRKLHAYTLLTGALAVVLEVWLGRMPWNWEYFGLWERLIAINSLVWVAIVAYAVLLKQEGSGGRG